VLKWTIPSLATALGRTGVSILNQRAEAADALGEACPPAVLAGMEVETIVVLTVMACGALSVKGVEDGLCLDRRRENASTESIVGIGEIGLGS